MVKCDSGSAGVRRDRRAAKRYHAARTRSGPTLHRAIFPHPGKAYVFKNFMVYRIGAGWSATVKKVEESLDRARFTECAASQERSLGWVEPRGLAHGALVESVGGQWILKFMIEVRLLPASVVRRATLARIEKIEAKTGRKPGKKQAKEIREDVTRELLPQAFTRQTPITVWIDPAARLLAIDTTSQARADEVMTGLIRSLDRFGAAPLQTTSAPHTSMAQWLTERQAPGRFDLDRECELKSTDDMQSAVKYSRHLLDLAEIRQHVEGGKLPTRLAMAWNGRVSFLLTDTLQLKKIRFLDGVFKAGAAEDDDRLDADTAIATGEMQKLIPDLIAALGGEVGGEAAAR